ncbi:helix-turn-helix domain-containing protein [Clostridium scatologenes]|uniref:Putative transcriptional regulator n=1 Tax=Clostridium scatologenes TaxID=1548 RepID=A0A0E3M8G9_CLOSL|nr:helix-turn-helix transcriptional regulator [Clostridium scatologenes]AKA69813.1 putative transcriptional regulator [Clostridium scatologenes]
MFLSSKLKELRRLKGVKQEDLAKYCEIAVSAIGHYETGRRIPNSDLVKKFAQYFDIEFDTFYDVEPQEKDVVSKLLDELIEKGYIEDPDKISDIVVKMIMDAVKIDIRKRQLDKGRCDII